MIQAQFADMAFGFFVVFGAFVDPVAEERQIDVGNGFVVDFFCKALHIVGCEVDMERFGSLVLAEFTSVFWVVFSFACFCGARVLTVRNVAIIFVGSDECLGKLSRICKRQCLKLLKVAFRESVVWNYISSDGPDWCKLPTLVIASISGNLVLACLCFIADSS